MIWQHNKGVSNFIESYYLSSVVFGLEIVNEERRIDSLKTGWN
jgi:hypothetical protein